MNPKKEIEINEKINCLIDEIMQLPEMQDDVDFQKDLHRHTNGLRWLLINRIMKYEYVDYFIESKKRKALAKKFFPKRQSTSLLV